MAVALLAGCAGSSAPELGSAQLANGQDVAGATASTTGSAAVGKIDKDQVSKAAAALTATATPGTSSYKIGPQDLLEISVFQVSELQRTVQVSDTGTINLPLVGEIPAGGLTAQQVEQDLTRKLGAKFLQSPQVTVLVKEYNSQRVTVDGAVAKPGVYPIRGSSSLMQVVTMAGGLTATSDMSNVVVFRQKNGKRSAAAFDFDAIRAGTAEDPALQAGDVVVANSSKMKEAFETVLKALPLTRLFTVM